MNKEELGIIDWLELIKEDRNLNGAYISISQYIYLVEKENKELKKQFENCYCERTDCGGRLKDSKVYDSLVQKVEKQQKEFIKYLEDEIYSIEPKGTSINYNCEYDSEEDYVNAMQEMKKLDTLKKILHKYKEIL